MAIWNSTCLICGLILHQWILPRMLKKNLLLGSLYWMHTLLSKLFRLASFLHTHFILNINTGKRERKIKAETWEPRNCIYFHFKTKTWQLILWNSESKQHGELVLIWILHERWRKINALQNPESWFCNRQQWKNLKAVNDWLMGSLFQRQASHSRCLVNSLFGLHLPKHCSVAWL